MRLMMDLKFWLLAVALGTTTAACGDDKTTPGDDIAGTDVASDVAPDTANDAASEDVGPDLVTPDVSPADAADTAPDTAPDDVIETDVAPPDTDLPDTTPTDVDPGDTELPDTTPTDTTPTDTTPSDVGPTDTTPDTETPQGDNVFVNGSFEQWADGLPIGWYGAASNLSTDNIGEDLLLPKEGLRGCQLMNTSSTHKRFSSAPQAFEAGRYTCTYWVRGDGQIRNARYNGTTDSYSSYSSYTTVATGAWMQMQYEFNVASDVAAFELIFSIANTSDRHLSLDDVRCTRAVEACDVLTCVSWQRCNPTTVACETAPGYCADDLGCAAWEVCDDAHLCVLAEGYCNGTIDCGGETPVCDLTDHTCVAGDPCEGVVCDAWEACNPVDSGCDVAPGRCESLADCAGDLPVCDLASHTCVAIDDPKNIIPNGGFEAWSDFQFGATTYRLPDFWYGLADGGPYFPETEIPAGSVRYYDAAPHSGTAACQLVDTGSPADRFTTEPFTVTSGVNYDCAYWVRGHGTARHRVYCGAWDTDTDFVSYDTDVWQQVRFSLNSASARCVLVFYASNTVADRDHIQLDDVVCIRR